MSYPQALNRPKAKVNESDKHLLKAFQKVTIIIPLIDVIRHIPAYGKFLKGIWTPHRNPKRIQLSKTMSSIMMNSLPIKKRDLGAPMITRKIREMTFTRSLIDTEASINIFPKAVFDRHCVGELQPLFLELCLADGLVRKPHDIVEDVIDGYYVAYKLITLSCILFMIIEMKFIHCHSCVIFVMKSMSMCND